jgi:dGTPase
MDGGMRGELEACESQTLAPYAMCSVESRGRAHPEPEHPYRTAFQRDRERIIHTTAFRRLEYKTQVFVITEGDHYRTRLTHTIEVAQIGRAMARALRANEDLTEAICLAHDLGHPPFGHSGEDILNRLMTAHGGFDHNAQSLRVVDWLEERYPNFRGLNLTWELREGIIKHETDYDASDASGFEPGWQPTIEAQLVNFADEFAYTAADLEDGLRAGILTPGALQGLVLWEEAREVVDGPFTDLTRYRLNRWLINRLVTDLVQATRQRIDEWEIDSVAAVRQAPAHAVAPSDQMRKKTGQLKKFLLENFYRHHRLVRMAAKARRILEDMFESYLEEPQQLPPEVLRRAGEETPDLHRAICDYIAGMTDRFALEEHARLFDPSVRV